MLLAGVTVPAAAQRTAAAPYDTAVLSRALDAERSGAVATADSAFALVLRSSPANVPALMGIDRMAARLNRRDDLLPWVRRALAVDSTTTGVLLEALRCFAMLGRPDSAAKYAQRWSAETPGDESPYREWSMAALEVRDAAQAQSALEVGRGRLGPGALGLELAQLLQQRGDIAPATREWIGVVRHSPELRDGAAGQLAQVPPGQRAVVQQTLAADSSREARQLLGLVDLTWGDLDDGARLVQSALPGNASDALALLNSVIGALHDRRDRAALQIRGAALESMAQREPAAAAVRTRLAAASAYADAGDERDARRLLDQSAASGDKAPAMAEQESAARLDVLVAEGNAADAEKILAQLNPELGPDQHDDFARRIAVAWARKGNVARAEALVQRDSSTAGLDLRGWLALYHGDLAGATTLFKAAGPFDDDRARASSRVSTLALLQVIGKDTLPALGQAFRELAAGDSAQAVTALGRVAVTLDSGAAAEVRLLAGRIALARGDTSAAVALLHQADVAAVPASAAAAQYELARISATQGRSAEASAILEQLLVAFPESAVAPEARRLYDTLRGAVPDAGHGAPR